MEKVARPKKLQDTIIWGSLWPIVATAVLLGVAVPAAWSQGVTEIIVMTGDPAPHAITDGLFDGAFDTFSVIGIESVLNGLGQVAFFANLSGTSSGMSNDEGIFLGGSGPITRIAREFGAFLHTINPTVDINDAGQVAYQSINLSGAGILRNSDGTPLTQIVSEGDAAPDGDGFMGNIFMRRSMNGSGQVAFEANLTNTVNNTGIFRGSGGALTQIVRRGDPAPDANRVIDSVFVGGLNESGEVGFHANLSNTTSGNADTGIFRSAGSVVTRIARAGDAAPDGNGVFSSFFSPTLLNDLGQVTFHGVFSFFNDDGIFRGSGGPLTQIVRTGDPAPDGDGVFSGFSLRDMNSAGQVMFEANLTATSNGRGIFLGDGIDVMQVARVDQSLAGSTIAILGQFTSSLNDAGQVVYNAVLSNGNHVIARFTPLLPGDFDSDGVVNCDDIDLIRDAILASTSDSIFDVDGMDSDIPTESDFDYLITAIIGTGHGDADLNKIINFADFVPLANNFRQTDTTWKEG